MAKLNPLYYALHWFQKLMKISDWKISLCLQDEPPEWAGDVDDKTAVVSMSPSYRTAEVWISEKLCKEEEVVLSTVLFHELLHVVALDAGLEAEDCNLARVEFFWNRLECVFADLYDRRIKMK